MTVLVPDAVLDRGGIRRQVAVTIDDAGRIVGVGAPPDDVPATERLRGALLVPGFRNGHSHAFQRDLRGRTEQDGGDFWRWRDAMYELAAGLDPASIHDVSRRCFGELVAAGYTEVAEFHYVHHRPDGRAYPDANAMAKAVAEAAETVGIRITLLLVAYERGGHPRFRDGDVGTYLERLAELGDWASGRPLVAVGTAPHSVRAVSRRWLESVARDVPAGVVSVHVDEQQREVDECVAEHGCRPIELLDDVGLLRDETVLVHATCADEHELSLAAAARSTVCVCPSTEADLADGPVPTVALRRADVPMCVGSDSNVIVDPMLEVREIELAARRATGRRGSVALDVLLGAAWRHDIEPGAPADLVAFDLGHSSLAGLPDEALAAALVFSGTPAAVTATWVAGRRVHGR
jgi:formimidoylglutamate deiminase